MYSYDVSMRRDWSVDASGVHENDPRERPNHGAAIHGLGVNILPLVLGLEVSTFGRTLSKDS